MKEDPRSWSALSYIEHVGSEWGIAAMQAEVRHSSAVIDFAASSGPRAAAAGEIEVSRAACLREIKDLEKTLHDLDHDIDDDREPEQREVDRDDALVGIQMAEARLSELDRRYQILIGDTSDDDPAVMAEIDASTKRVREAEDRLAEVEARLARIAEARVTAAIRAPKPYHSEIEVDSSLPVEIAAAERRQLLLLVEEYRAKWGIKDPQNALGPTPENGPQLEDWSRVARAVWGVAGPAHTPSR